jgi:hypothetical protein
MKFLVKVLKDVDFAKTLPSGMGLTLENLGLCFAHYQRTFDVIKQKKINEAIKKRATTGSIKLTKEGELPSDFPERNEIAKYYTEKTDNPEASKFTFQTLVTSVMLVGIATACEIPEVLKMITDRINSVFSGRILVPILNSIRQANESSSEVAKVYFRLRTLAYLNLKAKLPKESKVGFAFYSKNGQEIMGMTMAEFTEKKEKVLLLKDKCGTRKLTEEEVDKGMRLYKLWNSEAFTKCKSLEEYAAFTDIFVQWNAKEIDMEVLKYSLDMMKAGHFADANKMKSSLEEKKIRQFHQEQISREGNAGEQTQDPETILRQLTGNINVEKKTQDPKS